MPSPSKQKGNRGEYKVRDGLTKWWGASFRRTPSSGAYSTIHASNKDAGDVMCDDPVFPFCVEVKNQEKWTMDQLLSPTCKVWDWWVQAVEQSPSDKTPLLCFTRNRQPIYVMINYSTFCDALFSNAFPMFEVRCNHQHVVVFKFEDLLGTPKDVWIQD